MSLIRGIFFILLTCIITTGCEEDVPAPQKSRDTLLTELPWKLVGEFQRIGALPAWGVNSHFPSACEADNQYQFTTTGFYRITEGASKCIPVHPDVIASEQWVWLQANNLLVGTVLHTIERLDDNNLVLVFPRRLGGREIQVRWVFVH
jgi:hypothetical protein